MVWKLVKESIVFSRRLFPWIICITRSVSGEEGTGAGTCANKICLQQIIAMNNNKYLAGKIRFNTISLIGCNFFIYLQRDSQSFEMDMKLITQKA